MSRSLDSFHLFDSLRAEAEAPWLGQMFLPPREFDLMTESHSILIMGGEGSGKTTLEIQLKAHAIQKQPQRLLVASWRPQLPTDSASSDQVVEAFMAQVMDSLSFAFLQVFAHDPVIFSSAPSWTRDFMFWFVKRYLQGDGEYHLSQLTEQAVSGGVEIVTRILSETPRSLFSLSTSISTLPKLTENVMKLGFEGIWVFVDGLDGLYRVSPDRLVQSLEGFLSTLELFEDSTFDFKIIVSNELGQRLQKTRSVLTRRFRTYHLKWQENDLIRLVERRLSLVLRRDVVISELCKDEVWLEWMKHYAGDSPRGWLELTRPMLAAYLEKGKSITSMEWRNVYRQSPPPLRLDLEAGRVFIGSGEVSVIGIGYQLLRYLYEHRHRPCTKSELYYRAHRDWHTSRIAKKTRIGRI